MKPQELGPYLLLRKLAENALCETYRAGQRSGDEVERVVLLYVFNCNADEASWLAETAQAGRSALRGLASPCLSPAVDSGEIAGTAYLAYDYIPGRSLETVLEKTRSQGASIPIEHALLITDRVAQGLLSTWEHESRVLHGFVVPHLIMLSNEGDVQLLGMEVASRLRKLLSESSVSEQMGAYLAPEVVSEGQPATTDDVFSLGAILHELVTGQCIPHDVPDGFLDQVKTPAGQDVPEVIGELLRMSLVPSQHRSDLKSWSGKLNEFLVSGEYDVNSFNLAMFLHASFASEIEKEDEEGVPVSAGPVAPEVDAADDLDVIEDDSAEDVDSDSVEFDSLPPLIDTDADATAGRNRLIGIAAAAVVALVALGYGAYKFFGAGSSPEAPSQNRVATQELTPPTATDSAAGVEDQLGTAEATDQVAGATEAAEPELPPEKIERRVQNPARKRSAEVESSLRQEHETQLTEVRKRLESTNTVPPEKKTEDGDLPAGATAGDAEVGAYTRPGAQVGDPSGGNQADVLLASDQPSPLGGDALATADLDPDEAEEQVADALSSADMTQNPQAADLALETGTKPQDQGRAAGQPSVTEPEMSRPEPSPARAQEEPAEPAVDRATVEVGQLVGPGPGVVAPRLAKSARPLYPPMAQRLRKQAVVTVRVLVDENGRVLEAERVGDEAGYGFDEAALQAAQRSLFSPATKDGVNVRMWSTVRIAFKP